MQASRSDGAALVVVAHPDDETVFFGGLIADQVAAGRRVDVLSATSVFGDSVMTSTRRAEFRRACWTMGARAEMLPFGDRPQSIPLMRLTADLHRIAEARPYARVYTHGIWGEYGHEHHRDVCVAVHRVFGTRVLSLAGPLPPEHRKHLTDTEWNAKRRTARTYHSQRFVADWCSREERLVTLPLGCVETLYKIGNDDSSIDDILPREQVEVRAAARASLEAFRRGTAFPDVANIPREIWAPVHADFAARIACHVHDLYLDGICDAHRYSNATSPNHNQDAA